MSTTKFQSIGSAELQSRVLWLLLAVASLALGWVLLPFYGSLMWSSIIALLFAGTNRRLVRSLRGRRNLAALLTLLLVLILVVLPLVIVSGLLSREAAALYQRIHSGQTDPVLYFRTAYLNLPQWASGLLHGAGLDDFSSLQRKLATVLAQGSQLIAGQVLSFGQDTFNLVVSAFVTLYVAFFLIRDGEDLAGLLQRGIPLASRHKQELLEKFMAVIRATVKGNILVAIIQGTLGGLAFWFLDVSGAMLWAVVMGFLSLLPAVGAALVWFPVVVYFFLTGAVWQGIALLAFGLLVIGLIDNLLRPILVGKDAGLPDFLVLITTVGGIAVFGINGLVLGPLIAAMFIAVWHIHLNRSTASSA